MKRSKAALAIGLLLAAGGVNAQDHGHAPYAGFDQRPIAALSNDDLDELRAGRGWGLALPAELNGVPGPTHLLELSDEIGLNTAQVAALTDIRGRMQDAAIEAGLVFIEAERALNDAFVGGVPDAETLAELVAEAGDARAALRLAHLSAHLETLPLLEREQVAAYNRLRGYAESDPCAAVPEGHDADMWRRHNGCE